MKTKTMVKCFLIFIISLASCKKYLNSKPDSSLSVPSSIEDLQAILDGSDYMNQRSPCLDEASADNYFLLPESYNQVGTTGRQVYTWMLNNYQWPNDWSNGYLIVYNANLCLANIENIPRDAQNGSSWDNVKGSALVYRALSFLRLAWIYSQAFDAESADKDLGIALRLGTDFNVPSVRASVKDTYQQIISDLMIATPLLPDVPVHIMRPSKGAVYGLLARTYLSMRAYDSAYKYSNLCLQIKNKLMNYNEIDTSSSNPFPGFNEEVIFHTDISNYTVADFNPDYGRVDTALFKTYDSHDIRKHAFFDAGAGYAKFKGTYASGSPFGLPLFTGIATDEMYLTRAECEVRMGNKDAALNDLNILLEARYQTGSFVPVTAPNSADALKIILSERRKELIFRGLRWMDIKRLNKENYNIGIERFINNMTYILSPNSSRFALQLPSDVVNISGMPQNP